MKYQMGKAKQIDRGCAIKLLLMFALDIQQDILLAEYEGQDRVSHKKVKEIIKLLED